jgi:methyl-accepting chemotaxis protein
MTVNLASLLKFGIFQKMLLAMLLVALVPLSIIWYIDYRSTITQTTATVDQQLTGVSDKLTAQVNDWVGMNLKALNQNAALPDMKSMDAKRQNPILRTMIGEYQWSFLAHSMGPDGMNVGRSDDKAPIDYSDRVYFKKVMEGSAMGQQVVISKTNNKPALLLSAPISTTDAASGMKKVIGVLAMGMSITDISERITNPHIGTSGFAFLLDENGKVVAHQKQEYADTSADFSKHPAFTGRPAEGKKQLVYDDAGKKVIAIVQITQPGWALVTQQDHDEAYAPIAESKLRALLILGSTLVVVTVFAFLLSQGLTRPIRNLTHIAEDLSRGGVVMKINEVNRRDEIGALAAAIDRMGVSIRLAMDRLKAKT